MNDDDVLFKVTQAYSEKGNPSPPIRSQTKDGCSTTELQETNGS